MTTATADRPAEITPQPSREATSAPASLKLTLCPTSIDPDNPFLAQVFVKTGDEVRNNDAGRLLGTVAFFQLKVGKPQDFVMSTSGHGLHGLDPQDANLSISLVPANPDRALEKTAVEVVRAQFQK